MGYIDPFCAPEFLVDDVSFRTMVGADYLRLGFHTLEQGENILRIKLIFPLHRLLEVQNDTRLFVAVQQRCLHARLSRMAN